MPGTYKGFFLGVSISQIHTKGEEKFRDVVEMGENTQ